MDEIKREQRHVNETLVSGKDVFVSRPTSYGKSFCYGLLPAIYDNLRLSNSASTVICVSPLTALLMEQRATFAVRGVATEFVGELQQDVDTIGGAKSGFFLSVQSLYCAIHSGIRCCSHQSTKKDLVALVVDEAHCVTQW